VLVGSFRLISVLPRWRTLAGYEGLAFTPDGSALWVAMEGPLYEDGPVCTAQAGAYTRLLVTPITTLQITAFVVQADQSIFKALKATLACSPP
jgi:hypothetical protein